MLDMRACTMTRTVTFTSGLLANLLAISNALSVIKTMKAPESCMDADEDPNPTAAISAFNWYNNTGYDGTGSMLRGRQCAIVGSGPGLRSGAYGAEIDKHEVVIRVNRMPPRNGSWAKQVGQRTDVLFSGKTPKALLRLHFFGGEVEYCYWHTCGFGALLLLPENISSSVAAKSRIPWGVETDAVAEAVFNMAAPGKASSGLHAVISMALECKSVRLYGFAGLGTVDGHLITPDHNTEHEHKLIDMLERMGSKALPPTPLGVAQDGWPAMNVTVVC
eukprot:gnl/TRDRNA2_/TRDRNA2_48852_c0_seq1.p1 gnl/TRDRNA2_/TRDRNA2_48852_c0~~gnl/TRDRNA2_/TRDRNA2_48852_c0_seq1.p1  ORF type:complete len:276 (+),score=32.73 gnl/TRDRNA2_/TRDRNA2_48852_c0_seq1:68-895(+)